MAGKKSPEGATFYSPESSGADQRPDMRASAAKPAPAVHQTAQDTQAELRAMPVQTEPKRRGRPPGPRPELEPEPSQLSRMALDVDTEESDLTADAGIVEQVDERVQLKRDIERIRAQRKPFGAFTQKLALPERAGYKRHWFNDEPGRRDEAESNGWAQIKDKEGKPVRRVVGRGRDAGALYAYAMELPRIFWEEDMQARHDAAQARIDEIKKNPFRAAPGQATQADQGKFYSPKDEPLRISQPHK